MTPCVRRVLAFIESRTDSRMTETKVQKHDKIRDYPMDLDSVVKGKGQEQVLRLLLHLWQGRPQGHRVTECWSRDRASNKGSGRKSECESDIFGKRQIRRARYRRSERLELSSFKTASGEILPDEGQLMWPCFLQDGRKCWLRGHVTDVHKPLISAGKDKVAILHSSGGSIHSWNSPTGILISRAMTMGPREARTDELVKLYKENNIYNFYVKGPRWKLAVAKFRHRRCESVLPRSYAESVQQLSGGSRQTSIPSCKADFAVSKIPTWMLCLNWETHVQARAERECRGLWRVWSGRPRPICSRRSRGG